MDFFQGLADLLIRLMTGSYSVIHQYFAGTAVSRHRLGDLHLPTQQHTAVILPAVIKANSIRNKQVQSAVWRHNIIRFTLI